MLSVSEEEEEERGERAGRWVEVVEEEEEGGGEGKRKARVECVEAARRRRSSGRRGGVGMVVVGVVVGSCVCVAMRVRWKKRNVMWRMRMMADCSKKRREGSVTACFEAHDRDKPARHQLKNAFALLST